VLRWTKPRIVLGFVHLTAETADCLVEEGYAGLSTRRVAERAGVARSTLMHYATTLFPDQAEDPKFPALLDGAIAVIRGLVMEIPIAGIDAVTLRWEAIKPILCDVGARLLDPPAWSRGGPAP
jgi:Bacterial regulatory proteins, tetR family